MSTFSKEELIDDGSFNGVRKWLSTNDDGDAQVRYEGLDAAPILEYNKAMQNEDHDSRSEMWHAAKIPASVMYEWLVKFGVNAWNPEHMPAVKKLLNSSDYRYLRIKNFIM